MRKLFNYLSVLVVTFTLIAISSDVFAERRHHRSGSGVSFSIQIGTPYYYYPQYQPYYRNYYYYGYGYRQCSWVRGHYNYYGYWVPPHRVCWR